MKKIIIFLPISLKNKFASGISIRIDQLIGWFKKKGLKTIKVDKIEDKFFKIPDIYYLMISTKRNSISYQVIQKIPKDKLLIVDLYTPLLLEKESSFSWWRPQDILDKFKNERTVKNILKKGSHFFVANHRQENYWIRKANSLGVKLKSPDFSVLPTGSSKIKVHRLPMFRRKVILHFGGIYPWINPEPLVDAFCQIAPQYPEWKLRFIGGFHPQTGYRQIYEKIIKKAKGLIPNSQLDVVNWQEQQQLSEHLKDVVFAVHLSNHTLEDYYSHRVRLLTLLCAQIPVLTSGSDLISWLIVKNLAGLKISDDPIVLAEVIESLIYNPGKIKIYTANTRKIEPLFIKSEENVTADFSKTQD